MNYVYYIYMMQKETDIKIKRLEKGKAVKYDHDYIDRSKLNYNNVQLYINKMVWA